ncbi:MAG TPA: hypothetical protein VHG51_20870 [Longimicrobiaceae bacterium]|nr:hypothetical protein [Longimicrobiaceae bacterium]
MSLPYTSPTFAIPRATLQRLVDRVFARAARRPTVLLAIEDEALRDAARSLLVRALFTVVEPHGGELSAESVATFRPDLVLADVRTPDGWLALGRLRADPAVGGVPVVGLGPAPREAGREWARRLGVECVVPVPFDPDGLVDLVERVTGG